VPAASAPAPRRRSGLDAILLPFEVTLVAVLASAQWLFSKK
jgi:hypothetical protein